MKCLHICNDLMGSKVHENLYHSLSVLGVDQTIFFPLRKQSIKKVGQLKGTLNEHVVVSNLLNNSHRIFFNKKISYLYSDLKSKVDLHSNGFDLVHASTLFSDGAVALKIHKEFNIPYIVAVRSTDMHFLNFRYDLHPLARDIVGNAEKLIFVSQSLEQRFQKNKLIQKLSQTSEIQRSVICNGLDSFWLQNIKQKKRCSKPTNILYIGKFNTQKNVVKLINAFLQVSEKHPDLRLNLVGSGGNQEKDVKKLANENKHAVSFHGPIHDKKQLQKMYLDNDIFAMPSISETFGLVYIEALTQGLPILYSENIGVDGLFKHSVGEVIKPSSIDSIAQGLENLILNYSNYDIDEMDFSEFSWESISDTYLDLYRRI